MQEVAVFVITYAASSSYAAMTVRLQMMCNILTTMKTFISDFDTAVSQSNFQLTYEEPISKIDSRNPCQETGVFVQCCIMRRELHCI